MNQTGRKSPLERFLSLFAEVHAGEGITTILLALNVFLLLTCYYMIKPVREALILTEGGAEIKSFAAAGQGVLLLGAVSVYGAIAARVPRRTLINSVTFFFAACMVLFFILGNLDVPLGVVFYLWVGIFNLMIVAQFYSMANDLHTPEEGKRLFSIIVFGSNAGAIAGSLVVGRLVTRLGVYPPLLISAAVLGLSLLITNYVLARAHGKAIGSDSRGRGAAERPLSRGNPFKLVLTTPYLLLLALLFLVLNLVNTTGEYLLGRVVADTADQSIAAGLAEGLDKKQFIGKFYADFFSGVNTAAVVIQLLLVSRILKFLGVRGALLVLPCIAMGAYGIISLFPVLSMVRWAKTAENATDYSLQNTLRAALFLPTTREQKYKAKQAIDTFFVRVGDLLSAAVVALGAYVLHLSTSRFAVVNMVFVGAWLILAYLIGKRYVVLARGLEASEPEAA